MPTVSSPTVETSSSPEADLERLDTEVEEDLRLLKEYRRLVLQAEQVQQRIMQRHNQHSKEIKKVSERVKDGGESESDGKTQSGGNGASTDQNASSASKLPNLNEKCTVLQTNLDEVGSVKPSTGSIFVRLFLGRVNVREVLQRDRDRLREEYDKFKYRTNFVFLVIPLLWAIVMIDFRAYIGVSLTYTHWVPTLTHIWLLYYYVSLSLRENILRVNGSRIMAWWIYHHYISATMSIIVLTWPDTPTFRSIMPLLTAYFGYQAVVQFVQTWYQRRRHYALRALGRAGRMDPTTTEGLNEFHPGLWVVVVLVIVAYCFQLYMSYELMWVALYVLDLSQPWYKYKEEIQCIGCSLCFLVLGVVNFAALAQTLRRKRKRQLTTFKLSNVGASSSSEQGGPVRQDNLNQKYKMSPFLQPLSGSTGGIKNKTRNKEGLRHRGAGTDSSSPSQDEPPPMSLPEQSKT
eukprot:gb/GECG01004480.1/.p1 GENE.gb/GECG01004480.1/~~gb/GECG01004480.1/.p1  ORF type:complete len:461 (+),score=42.66 gb/GECG01004480.1/:1-1383(+)